MNAMSPKKRDLAMAPIRVLHVVNGDHYAGAERVQDLLALRLPDHGYVVAFATLKQGLFAAKRKSASSVLHETPMRGRADLSTPWRIARLVREHRYQLIHTHTARSAMVGRMAAMLTGVPMVHHVHSPTARDTESALRNRVNVVIEALSLWRVRWLIAVSDSMARYMREKGYRSQLLLTVPNGVPSLAVLQERPLPGPVWVVGMVALFRPRKGLEVLLQAVARLRGAGQQVRLLAVGPFETEVYKAEIFALSQRLGLQDAVEWTGFTADVGAQLSRMDIFALPSLYGEGMPMVVLEAMGHGIPLVASAVEGIPEVVTHGKTGLLVEPGDPTALADAVAGFIGGQFDWSTIRSNAWQHQRVGFSDASMAAGVAKVYDAVLRRATSMQDHGE